MCFSKVSGPTRKRRVARLEKSLIKRSETLFLSVRILGSINYTYIVDQFLSLFRKLPVYSKIQDPENGTNFGHGNCF